MRASLTPISPAGNLVGDDANSNSDNSNSNSNISNSNNSNSNSNNSSSNKSINGTLSRPLSRATHLPLPRRDSSDEGYIPMTSASPPGAAATPAITSSTTTTMSAATLVMPRSPVLVKRSLSAEFPKPAAKLLDSELLITPRRSSCDDSDSESDIHIGVE
jgi:hypothetical protein